MGQIKWQRNDSDHLYGLDVYECPAPVLAALAEATRVGVIVENVAPVAALRWFEFTQAIKPGGPVGPRLVRDLRFDVALDNAEFLELMPLWDQNGVYAVFAERNPVPFRASALEPPGRYRALDNFGFILEFALAGPSSSGWSSIRSPQHDLTELAESLLND